MLKWKGWVVPVVGLTYALGVLIETKGFNGPWYWTWQWRSLDLIRTATMFGVPLILLHFSHSRIGAESQRAIRPAMFICLLVATNFLMQLMGVLAEGESFSLIGEIVRSPNATSYFTDATKIHDVKQWLAHFHQADLELHSSTHPPGPILYYYLWLKLLGPNVGALAGGCLVGLLGSAGVAAIFFCTTLWTSQFEERAGVACLYALAPATVVFFPEFDQVYPLLSMGLVALFIKAVETNERYALAHGLVLWITSFFAYHILTVGSFIALYALYVWVRPANGWSTRMRILRVAGVSLGIFLLGHAALHLATGFQPVLGLAHALQNQEHHAATFERARPYFDCVALDLYDFLIGAGMPLLPLVVFWIWGSCGWVSPQSRECLFSTMGLLTILIVDLTGLLRAETARVWLFLLPFLAIPAGLAYARLPRGDQTRILWVEWFALVVLKCKMWFIHT